MKRRKVIRVYSLGERLCRIMGKVISKKISGDVIAASRIIILREEEGCFIGITAGRIVKVYYKEISEGVIMFNDYSIVTIKDETMKRLIDNIEYEAINSAC